MPSSRPSGSAAPGGSGARRTTRSRVAYFSCEFGLDESLPIYSGGLGVLAGDHLKSASDLGVPLVGVGLFYREGYFRQQLDENDWQGERYPEIDPSRLPLTLESPAVSVEIADDDGALVTVRAQVWRAQVGRVPLYLLDTDVDGNPDWARAITDRLYGGDRRHRLRQELVLGLGGVRALRALGVEPTVFHMNEGHSAFFQLERLRELVEEQELSRDNAHGAAPRVDGLHDAHAGPRRQRDLRPVARRAEHRPARRALRLQLGRLRRARPRGRRRRLVRPDAVRAPHVVARERRLGAARRGLALDVARRSGPTGRSTSVPIGSVTNGVHARTWISEELDALLGTEEDMGTPDFARAYDLDDEALWHVQRNARAALLDFMRSRGLPGSFDPEALTIGFARRFATYKRADLIFSDPARLARLLADGERPLQIVLAGKAHPADEGGKALIQKVIAFARSPEANGRVVFLPDYEMTLARYLVQGVDVWLNNPRRPLEASGTSGMKAALNGVVNVSILDGWWVEGYSPETGFAIGGDWLDSNDEAQDAADADALFTVLEQHVLPAYYERDERGLPPQWLGLMRSSIAQLGARFNTNRMLVEYVEGLYLPAHRDLIGQLQTA